MKPKERNGAGRGEEKKEWEGRGGEVKDGKRRECTKF